MQSSSVNTMSDTTTTTRTTMKLEHGGEPHASSRNSKDVAPFLKQLRKMLDHENHTILRWTPNGRAFEIVDMDHMMHHVLPKYFKHRKYTSFQRQLNYFNFRKWTKSKATVCTFSNDFFLRDQPELAWRISRKKSIHMKPQPGTASGTKHAPSPPCSPAAEVVENMPSPPPYWSKDASSRVAINVPTVSTSPNDVFTTHGSLPSPTDFDMMLKAHDYSNNYYCPAAQQQQQTSSSLPASETMESLEWIDKLLPFVDRIEDEIYPFMYTSSANLLVSNTNTMAPPARSYEYMSLAL